MTNVNDKKLEMKKIKLIIVGLCISLSGVGKIKEKPNIIVIKTDDQRWNSIGCYGDPIVKTPNIDALSKEGMRFENAYTVAALCVPSRTSFFSGKYASTTKRFDNTMESHIGLDQFSFIELLKDSGYKIALVGKNHAFQDKYLDNWFDYVEQYSPWGKEKGTFTESDKAVMKFRTTSGPPSSLGNRLLEGLIDYPEPFKEKQCMTSRIADDAITFVDQNKDHPFFMYMAFPAPHWPNIVCEPYFSMYMDQLDKIELPGMDEIDWDSHPFAHYVQSQATGFDTLSVEGRKKILAIMYGQITFIDKSVGRLVDELKKQGLYDNTLIVFTADQGCFGGQFGLPSKTKGFYDPLIRVPLIVKKPGDKSLNRVRLAKILNIDVMPTIMEYTGIGYDEKIDGKSFLPVLKGESDEHRSAIFSEVGRPLMPPAPISKKEYPAYNAYRLKTDGFWFIDYTTLGRCAAIKENGWKYCFYNGDMEELYNTENDPIELTNLAYVPEQQERKEAMKKKLFEQGFVGISENNKKVEW